MKMLAIVITETFAHYFNITKSKQTNAREFRSFKLCTKYGHLIFFLNSRNILHNLSICVFIVHNVHTSYRLINFFATINTTTKELMVNVNFIFF